MICYVCEKVWRIQSKTFECWAGKDVQQVKVTKDKDRNVVTNKRMCWEDGRSLFDELMNENNEGKKKKTDRGQLENQD